MLAIQIYALIYFVATFGLYHFMTIYFIYFFVFVLLEMAEIKI